MLLSSVWQHVWRNGSWPSASALAMVAWSDWPQHTLRRHFGQPVAKTHPHLMKEGEVTPGVGRAEYKARRSKLVELAHRTFRDNKSVKDHIFIFPSAAQSYMTNDIPYVFRQNSDFLYLCGFQEPDSVLIIYTKDTTTDHHAVLFVPKRDPNKEMWDGPRSGCEGAVQLTGVNEALETEELKAFLSFFARKNVLFTLWYNNHKPAHPDIHNLYIQSFVEQDAHSLVENPARLTSHLRLLKSSAETALMKKSAQISAESFVEVMKFSYSGVNESHLFAKMDFECRIRNAEFLAYPPVVAGGARACTIHYVNNNQIVQEGELVLMDAGCEYHGYASDITRTWPVSGKFSPAQRALYDMVLRVQDACLNMCVTQFSLDDTYREMVLMLGRELQALGIISKTISNVEVSNRVRKLCPHHVGHYLGMDVHDTHDISRSLKYLPGMVVTIEPGIYIPENDMDAPAEFRGIGIRIEDNVLITKSSPIILTASCPKSPDEIEALMAQ